MTPSSFSGKDYADLVASYIHKNYSSRGLKIYREVPVGKSIIGKNRKIDIVLINEQQNEAFAIECKFQGAQGTVDEKIPYAIEDMRALHLAGCIVYAGEGFSEGVIHMLRASDMACFCLPDAMDLSSSPNTVELDHVLALHFKWWDVLIKKPEFIPHCPTKGQI